MNAKGRVGEASVSFSVSNWYTMTDHLQPPLSSGHFGTLDRLRTSSRTDGWEYATESVQHYFGDADRLVRSGNSEEYLVWEAPQLQAFRIVLYATDPTVVPHIMFELSGDQAEWVAAVRIEIEGPNAGGASHLDCRPGVHRAKWFRLRIRKVR